MRNSAKAVASPVRAVRAPDAEPTPSLPTSATDFRVALAALACFLAAGVALRGRAMDDGLRMIVLMAATAIPLALGDLLLVKVHRRASTGLDWDRPFRLDVPRVLTKLLGLAATLGVIALAYWTFPEYRGSSSTWPALYGQFFSPWYELLSRVALPAVVFAVVYVAFVDGKMRQPRDAYWQLGRLVLGNSRDARADDLAKHARGWLVKAFFLPLMITYFHNSLGRILDWNFSGATWESVRLYDFLYDGAFLVDLGFCTVGYVMSFRASDSHVRSAEPTMFGWVVALICYQPFFSVAESHYLLYGGPGFGRFLQDYPTLRSLWGGTILFLVIVYILATVAFGLRFSNLTHRGIITSGPYRFTKHPAYISKNLSWWLSSVPFAVAGGGAEQLRHALMLLVLNGIYFLRARTEERHLSQDPRYVEYALWMNENGALSWLGRVFPFFRYRAPKA
jgi:protein-S-isoprenylcysteine O-methyltransferase Ste14